MGKLAGFIKNELTGWKLWEAMWLLLANVVIVGVSLYLGDTVIGILASLTGVTCVILVGKGKVSNYIFGTINVLLYAYVAYKAKYYGDVMLNILYYFPTNFLGWFVWRKHMNGDNKEVYKERMTPRQRVFVGALCVIGISGYSFVLQLLGGNLPLIDSMSTVLSIVAQILMIKRYTEQWIVWIFVNIVSVIMWIAAFFNGGESIAVFMMWSVYLANAIIMFIKWYKESKIERKVIIGQGVKV